MDLRGVLSPVGPLPPRVYWLRRLLPLVGVAILVFLVAMSCSGGSKTPRRDRSATTTTPPASTSASTASATATGTAASLPACAASDVQVSAGTDATSYGRGQSPVLRMILQNARSSPCALTDSPSRRTWTIRSGSDLIWSTEGCQRSQIATRTRLVPGKPIVHTFVWNRHRTGPHCAATSVARPGTYQLVVAYDGVQSSPAVFTLAR